MSVFSNLGKYNNKLIFCSKISVKNESQETDIYVGEIAYQMRYISLVYEFIVRICRSRSVFGTNELFLTESWSLDLEKFQ